MTEERNKHNSHRKQRERELRRKKQKQQQMIHLGILGAILLVLIIAVIRFIVWNMGTSESYDPNEDTSEFDTERLDYIQPLDPALREGFADDGVTTMVCLGNAPFSDETGPDGLAQLIADETGAVVYNGAFPDSYVSLKNAEYSDSYPADGLSFYMVAASICNQNFDLMTHVVTNTRNDEVSAQALETLQSVDFSNVDILTIMYDMSDYIDKRINYDENNDENLLTYFGALNAGIRLIQKTYPHIRIIVLSHPFGEFENSAGELINGGSEDLGNGTLADYLLKEIDAAMGNGVSIIDNFYGTISEDKKADYLTDGYHLNLAGRKAVAGRLAEIL